MPGIEIFPIGHVRTKLKVEEIRGNRRNVLSEIEISKEFEDGLLGIEDYSHLIVLFWMDRTPQEERKKMVIHPWNDPKIPNVGVFAIRKRSRPNPIGLAVVELLEKKGNVLKVKGLDAIDGTPVIDIKSYDTSDRKEDIRVPEWWTSMRARRSKEASL
jgi:tRNA-Thr(GGU) m(6)t(6)A37 methyltransferase TsaA